MHRLSSLLGSLHNAVFIFDKDGTLVDTETLYFEVYNRVISAFGCRHDLETHARMMSKTHAGCLRILQDRHPALPQGDEALPSLLTSMHVHVKDVRRESGSPAMPGASNLLSSCRERGIRIAMATSATRENALMDLQTLGWLEHFEAVVTGDDVTLHKPHPDPYLLAARLMDAAPSDCIALEDSPSGVRSAHAAGIRVLFVRDARFGITPPPEAALTINSLEELIL